MNRILYIIILGLIGLTGCQKAPRPGYTEMPRIVQKREELRDQLLNLLPSSQRELTPAVQEATWLADTAYRASAAIARYNNPVFVNWLNNRAVNTRRHFRHRGLCWHYQHDLYRELRRRPLHYFRLGCCVRDKGNGSEHHVVYIAARTGQWPHIIMLDAWWYGGRLKVEDESETYDWSDEPQTTAELNKFYRAGHRLPMEHWAMIRRGTRYTDYIYSNTREARNSAQWQYMQQQMNEGMKRRRGKPADY